jgi:hypothetical protein
VFLAATVLSTLMSVDRDRSVRLGIQILPAVLLYFLVAEHFDGSQDIRLLYLTFSAVGLVLASMVLWAAWHAIDANNVRGLISNLRMPLLVVPNDLTFLAIIAQCLILQCFLFLPQKLGKFLSFQNQWLMNLTPCDRLLARSVNEPHRSIRELAPSTGFSEYSVYYFWDICSPWKLFRLAL